MSSHSLCPEVVLATSDVVYGFRNGFHPSGESFSRPGRLVVGLLGRATYGFVIADLQTLSSDNCHYKFMLSMTLDHTMTFTCSEAKKDVTLTMYDGPGNPATFTVHFTNILEFHKMVQLISEGKAHLLAARREYAERLKLLFQAQCAVPHPSDIADNTSPAVPESQPQSEAGSDGEGAPTHPVTVDVGVLTEESWSEGLDDDRSTVSASETNAQVPPDDRGAGLTAEATSPVNGTNDAAVEETDTRMELPGAFLA
ncbi:hypothetical protein BV20DRAFT_1048100 [Pilatotrama ljubarskyi]|nr:hypothetical protein BV20DRAFT_1048100 [Pilatotrama ljubarskyi]